MRHRVQKTGFSRNTNERKALIRTSVENLVMYGKVVTTRPKAKEVKRWADKLIHKGQVGTVSARRELQKFFGKRDVANTIVDRLVPLFTDRTSGFSRIITVGKRRGDNTEMVRLELIAQPEVVGSLSNPQPAEAPKAAKKQTKPAVKKAAKPAAKKAEPKVAKETKKTKETVKKPAAKKAPKKAAAKK